jgi:two-component system, response regulator FlrC
MHGLMSLEWPSNVRQLQNVIERAVIMSTGTVLDQTLLGLADEIDHVTSTVAPVSDRLTIRQMEQDLILRKLRQTGGNRTLAATELGISVRTLRNKLNLYSQMGITSTE